MPNKAASNMFCGICREKMNRQAKKPLFLPACGHSFCQECLIRMNEVEGRIDCPICRTHHQGQSPENLPVNWLLLEMLDEEEESTAQKAKKNTKEAPISPNQSSKDDGGSYKSSKAKDSDGENGSNSGNNPPSNFWRNAGIAAGSVIGGVGLVAAAPVVLTGVGFTSAGIAASSWAAGMMSSAAIANGGGVAAGSMVSIGMSLLPEKCLCFSLRTGTVAQGVLCLVIGCVNILMVLLGLGDFLDKRIYDFCWPSEDCYDKLKSLEKTIVIANIVINAFSYMFSILLLLGVRNNNPRYLVPFMFVQGLVASALVPAALMALVICAHVGSCLEKILISLCALIYITINVYLALVVRAYYNKMKKNRTSKELVEKIDQIFDNKKELTLEDYVF